MLVKLDPVAFREIRIGTFLVFVCMRHRAIDLGAAALLFLGSAFTLGAHPMGNFSVNHYSRLYFGPGATELTYVLDLAEIPAFQLLGQWRIDWKDQGLLSEKSEQQAKEWLENVVLLQGGQRSNLRIMSVSPTAVEGAGGMPVLRISITAEAALHPGDVTYEDRNFQGRAGWKEIVVDHNQAVAIKVLLRPVRISARRLLITLQTRPSLRPRI